jgi:aminoglycoside phosphotransferase family enzyme/predicted kinase
LSDHFPTTRDEAELCAWLGSFSERTIETACAHVFLGSEAAFKMKRHVDLGYADFSTAAKRLWALERELEFNRLAASDIYRAIRRITREPGGFAFEGAGETADFVLEMRRFDESKVLAACPDAVTGAMAEALGRTIAGFHAIAPLRTEGGLSSMDFTVGSNARLLREMAGRLGEERVERMIALTEAELARQRPLLAARTAQGFARRCHGDLHLGNILLEEGQPVLFDCIEFNDLLSDIDIQYDLAFILMDLSFRGRSEAAVRVLSAWLDQAGRGFGEALWEGLAALPLMLSVRAGVRAHVSAHSGDDALSRAYVDAAIAHLSPPPAGLVAVGGLSGTGKSRFSRTIATAVGPSPGAVVLRTDEVRKRLMGLEPTDRLPASAYEGELYGRTYDVLIDNARTLLKAGRGVIIDATFVDAPFRTRVAALAAECGVPFEGVWLEAPADTLRARIAKRTGDASDATLQTLDLQLARATDPVGWTRVDTSGPTGQAAEAWLDARR